MKKKKGSRLPTRRTHTSTCTPRGKKDEASVKKWRVGVVAPVVGEVRGARLRRPGRGRERRERKGCRKGWSGGDARARETGGVRGTDEGTSREGKDVGVEGRNRRLMRWWGRYVRRRARQRVGRKRKRRRVGVASLSTSARRVRKTSGMTIDHPPRREMGISASTGKSTSSAGSMIHVRVAI